MNGNEYAYVDRNIYLYGEVNNETALEVISAIKHINEYDNLIEEEKIESYNSLKGLGLIDGDLKGLPAREPITIDINSGGGHTSAGFSIISAIENSETPVIGYVTGDCMSMATAILASCHYRLSTDYARFMIHDIYSISEGKFNDLNSGIAHVKQIRENYKKVIVKYTNIDENKIEEITNASADYFFSPADGVEMGLLDCLDSDEEIDEALMMHKLYGIELPVSEESEKSEYLREAEEALKEISDDSDNLEEEVEEETVEELKSKISELEAFIGTQLDMED